MKTLRAMLVTLAALTLVACSVIVPKEADALSEPETRALVLRFHDAINRGDWHSADQMVTADYRHYVVTSQGFSARTWEDFRKGNQAARRASPDWVNTPTQVVVEGKRVAVLLAGHGTHVGSFAGEKPTGRSLDLPVMVLHETRGDKLAADWEIADTGPLLRALSEPPVAP